MDWRCSTNSSKMLMFSYKTSVRVPWTDWKSVRWKHYRVLPGSLRSGFYNSVFHGEVPSVGKHIPAAVGRWQSQPWVSGGETTSPKPVVALSVLSFFREIFTGSFMISKWNFSLDYPCFPCGIFTRSKPKQQVLNSQWPTYQWSVASTSGVLRIFDFAG